MAQGECGLTQCQFSLGLMHEKGRGVPQDYSKALDWYRKAAERGDARAQFNIGTMYEKGYGVTQDSAEATAWFE